MKIKTISRSVEAATRGSSSEVRKTHKNADPLLHPFERAREYSRAVRAVKMERMFAKPFLGAMDDHADGVTCLSTSPASLVALVSGAADGEVLVWDLTSRVRLWGVYAHASSVKGVSVARDGASFYSCGIDKTVKRWRLAAHEELVTDSAAAGSSGADTVPSTFGSRRAGSRGSRVAPMRVWSGRAGFTGVDCHWQQSDSFATSSTTGVDVWDASRSEPVSSFEWGADTVTSVRWNPAEPSVLASTSADRGIVLYDSRMSTPLRKATLALSSNAVAWNPREPMNFVVANEDMSLYSFDMRNLSAALAVHRDHTGPVMDVHFSPNGREFVSGGYDKTVRLWATAGAGAGAGAGRSREVYHTSRMQRVFAVRFTPDSRFVISGSDDTNVRIWKARASESLGRALPAERAAGDYREALKKKFGHMPAVSRIAKFRRVPKAVSSAAQRAHDESQVERRKAANVRAHSRPGAVVAQSIREKPVLKVSI